MDTGPKNPIKSGICFGQLSMDPLSLIILALIQLDEKIFASLWTPVLFRLWVRW